MSDEGSQVGPDGAAPDARGEPAEPATRAPAASRRPGVVRRLPILLVLGALGLLMLVVGDAAGSGAGEPDAEAVAAAAGSLDAGPPAALPPSDARSAAWFCAGSPPYRGTQGRVHVSNLGAEAVTVSVRALVDGRTEGARSLDVGPRATRSIAVGDLTDRPGAGVVVEPFSGAVVVEHDFTRGDALAAGPCATRAGTRWYFGNGTTQRGVLEHLVLFNPFAAPAVVDVALFTEEGPRRPEALQGLDVPARGSRVVAVHEAVRRQDLAAAVVQVRVGRVVAEQALAFGEESGRTGLAATLGSTAPARTWRFAEGLDTEDATRRIGILNPGKVDTEADVQVQADGGVAVAPTTVAVPAESAVLVRLGECPEGPDPACIPLADGTGYSLSVRAAGDRLLVAQDLATWLDRRVGAGGTVGAATTARRWVLGGGIPRSGIVTVLNASAEPVDVDVEVVTGGTQTPAPGFEELRIEPGQRRKLVLDRIGAVAGSVVVSADGPIVVERVLSRNGQVTLSRAVPALR